MHDKLIENIRAPIIEHYANGMSQVKREQILAVFDSEGVLPHERELAITQFAFRGLYQEQDEVTTVAPDYRIGVYDTDSAAVDHGWTEEDKEEVERVLIMIADRYAHLLVAPRSPVPPPWPRYDNYRGTTTKLMQKLVSEGHDLTRTLLYERMNQNRQPIVEAIESLLDDPDAQRELEPVEEEVMG